MIRSTTNWTTQWTTKWAALLAVPATMALVLASPSTVAAKPKADPSTVSKAITGDVLDAIAEEMERAVAYMKVPGAESPYLIRYKITEVEVNDVAATLGSTTSKKGRHFVNLEASVHVGSYKLDNTNFAIPQAGSIDGSAAAPLPLEPTPRIARRAAWLATDRAYKEALAQLNARKQFRAGGGSATHAGLSSFTPVDKARVDEKPVLVATLESPNELSKRAKVISAALRDQPHLRDSRVAFTSFLERRWYLTTEGTNVHDTRRVSGVVISVHGQAKDGQELTLYYSRYGVTGDNLPSNSELKKEALKLAKTMAKLQKAPMAEGYTGPVLFEGHGAVDMIRYTLAPHLGGSPVPEGLEKGQARQYGGAFANRVKRGRVLSPLLSVVDDPTTQKSGKRSLIGGFGYDDEGSPAQRVELIKKGTLQTLLMGRTPGKTVTATNGHARRNAPAGGYHGSATNLFVSSKKGLTRKKLVKQLTKLAKSEGLDYGIIIRKLDDGAITAAPERTRRELLTLINETDVQAPPPALLAYRVYANGKEELVRGVELGPVDVRAWKDVVATSKSKTVMNFLSTESPNLFFKLRGIAPGFVPSAGVESAVTTPDLLFKELELKATTSGRRPFPIVPRPTP